MISIISAVSRNGVIGKNGKLPWSLPEDMRFFQKTTDGSVVVMGRKTFESIGRPLKNRTNIILTRDEDYKKEGCVVYHDIQDVIKDFGDKNLMIIGGEEIYRLFLPFADRIFLTYIDQDFEGDAFFPEFKGEDWIKESGIKGKKDEKNPYDYYFQVYLRKK